MMRHMDRMEADKGFWESTRRKVSYSLKLELQMVMSYLLLVLGTELRASEKQPMLLMAKPSHLFPSPPS